MSRARHVVVAGGGWAGCAAALAARRAGAEVTVLERTDQLLGTGLVGGIMRNNGRFTATEEMCALGGGDLFLAADRVARHTNIEFPGHKHANLYDVGRIEPEVRRLLEAEGIRVELFARAVDVRLKGSRVEAVFVKQGDAEEELDCDGVVEATGTAGPARNCSKYGNGCAMCVLRCTTFGPRVSLAARAGVSEMVGGTAGGRIGAMSGSCKLMKESLAPELVERLDRDGVAVVPLPKELQNEGALEKKACQQYALKAFAENLVLLDTGHAKLMTSFFPLADLRRVPGLENARYEDPYAGGVGNSVRYLAISPHSEELRIEGLENMFCGGEKVGPLVGHTEAICSGALAGCNAARQAQGEPLLRLPTTLSVGHAIAYVTGKLHEEGGLFQKYTFSGSVYFQAMKEAGLYTTDVDQIRDRVQKAGLEGVFGG